jgi:pimeloyl-ACP methyl ester carboxylesterase
MNASTAAPSVVLVHGGFVDGSGWRGVYDLLVRDGHHVSVVQNPTLSLDDDVAATRLVIDEQDGPVVLVGHSYGGAVITQAGNHEKVVGLVYIAAFAPDRDESVNTLIANPAARRPRAADPATQERLPVPGPGEVPRVVRRRPARRGRRLHGRLAGALGRERPRRGGHRAAWRTKPSWYLVATEDRMIPPPAQRFMSQRAGSTVVEAAGSHSIYVSQPRATTALIEQAAAAVTAPR